MCGHVISAVDFQLFIIVLTDYDKVRFGLVFKVRQTEAHISYPIIANPFDAEEC